APTAFESPAWPHALHMLALMYSNRLEDARFLYKRCPPHVRDSQPQLQAAFRALQFLWQRDYAGLWPLLRSGWDPHQATLVRGIASNLREHVLRLVATAYSTISLQALAGALGATLPEAQQEAAAHGWELTNAPSGGAWVRIPPKEAAGDPVAPDAATLQRLASYVLHLEAA
ncbi:hypothetical protein APUTEX25_003908, partial [Auxenochlorella protothecoides]